MDLERKRAVRRQTDLESGATLSHSTIGNVAHDACVDLRRSPQHLKVHTYFTRGAGGISLRAVW